MVPRVRILTVARWYPGHDDPGRGSFVSDLTVALRDEAAEVRVASWDFAHYGAGTTEAMLAQARDAWSMSVAGPAAMNVPVHWGAGVPVARLPALYVSGESVGQRIDGHAALLVPFGTALYERWPFDVIHAHTAVPDGAAALELARRIGVPVMVTEHDRSLRQRLRDSEDERAAYRRVLEEAGLLAAVSAQFRELLTRELSLESGDIDVVPNPIPAAFFGQRLDGVRDATELIYVGGRKEDKGIVTLLETFARVYAERRELHLRLIGRSPNEADEARWHVMAEELGIADVVTFDPPADRGAVARAMARAGVFVHPSPFESFGMVGAEALASGLPVAATRSGIEEIVGEDGRFGEIADGIDAEALSRAILRVVDRRDGYDRQELREAASRFEASHVARDHIERYEKLIEQHGASRSTSLAGDSRTASEVDHEASRRDPALGRIFAVGQNAVLAERRVRTLPEELRERIVLATRRPGDSLRELLPGRVIELDPAAEYKRLVDGSGAEREGSRTGLGRTVRFLRSPAKTLERRRLRQDREHALVELLAAQVDDGWQGLPRRDDPPPVLLSMDVEDVAAAQAVMSRGVPLAPGSTRWLADRWDDRRSTAKES